MKIFFFSFCTFIIFSHHSIFAQDKNQKNFFGIRAGYIHSITAETSSQNNSNFSGINNKGNFYVGAFYNKNISKLLFYKFELNYQRKGLKTNSLSGSTSSDNTYNYIGLTPLIGITPIKNTSFYIGPEANILVSKHTVFNNSTPIEIGIVGRVSYYYKNIGIEAGYFKALNNYATLSLDQNLNFDFKNSNWQIGLIYRFGDF